MLRIAELKLIVDPPTWREADATLFQEVIRSGNFITEYRMICDEKNNRSNYHQYLRANHGNIEDKRTAYFQDKTELFYHCRTGNLDGVKATIHPLLIDSVSELDDMVSSGNVSLAPSTLNLSDTCSIKEYGSAKASTNSPASELFNKGIHFPENEPLFRAEHTFDLERTFGLTPIQVAYQEGHAHVLDFLISAGANIHNVLALLKRAEQGDNKTMVKTIAEAVNKLPPERLSERHNNLDVTSTTCCPSWLSRVSGIFGSRPSGQTR